MLWTVAALCTGAGGCATTQHVKLAVPGTSPEYQYVCLPTDKEEKCSEVAATSVPEPSGTVHVILPSQCQGKINQITIEDAGSDAPKVRVTCAQIGN